MVEIVWAEPAIADLEAVADVIALQDPAAAAAFVQRVLSHVAQMARHPESGTRIPEMPDSRHRQLVEPPCRIFYRYDGSRVLVVHVMRTERLLKRRRLGTARVKPRR